MKFFITIGVLFILAITGYFVYTPPTEIDEKTDTDTGFTRHETEEMMRQIGYVQ